MLFSVGGTATPGADYLTLPGSATIPAGAASATITVTPINDTLLEVDETVVVTLGPSAGYAIGGAGSATVTIVSDDVLPTVTLAATTATATEVGPVAGVFTVSRTGGTAAPLTVSYTVGGSATAGSDYTGIGASVTIPAGATTATITVMPVNDTLVEGDETVVLTLSPGAAYTVAAAAGSATVTIVSDDVLPTVSIAATTGAATETGPSAGMFTVTRTGSTAATLSVLFSVGGTATPGADYLNLPGSVAIPAGSATATITVTPVNDTAVEGDETVVVTLSPSAAYTVGAPGSATVTIASDDGAAATVSIAATTGTATEAGPGAGVFTVTRTGNTAGALTVSYTVGGTATAGSDYMALSGSVTLAAGAATATITVTPINDTPVEGDETVVVTLAAGAGYTVGTPASGTVTIVSDDGGAGLAKVDIHRNRRGPQGQVPAPGTFTLTRTGSTTGALTVHTRWKDRRWRRETTRRCRGA